MNKLIKIYNHYYIVDDSEIKENDDYLWLNNYQICKAEGMLMTINNHVKNKHIVKITHSTQEGIGLPLNLEDIEELVNGYNVEKLAEKYAWGCRNEYFTTLVNVIDCVKTSTRDFIEGFKAHEELSKDKLFTIDDMEYCYNTAKRRAVMQEAGLEPDLGFKDYMNKYHVPKTEWEIKFEDNKIVLV